MILLKNNNSNIHNTNHSNNQVLTLSPLFSNSNTKSIAPINARISGGGRANITFANNAANTPAITIGSGSRTIAHLFMDYNNIGDDDLGIRDSRISNFSYSGGAFSAWIGSGILHKPIGDFFTGTFNNSVETFVRWVVATMRCRLSPTPRSLPKPQEYAMTFGRFALGFVFFHQRRMVQKKRQSVAA